MNCQNILYLGTEGVVEYSELHICFVFAADSWPYFYLTLQEIDQPGLVPCISEANSLKYPYEVIFRSLQKLLMDTASSEYVNIHRFNLSTVMVLMVPVKHTFQVYFYQSILSRRVDVLSSF